MLAAVRELQGSNSHRSSCYHSCRLPYLTAVFLRPRASPTRHCAPLPLLCAFCGLHIPVPSDPSVFGVPQLCSGTPGVVGSWPGPRTLVRTLRAMGLAGLPASVLPQVMAESRPLTLTRSSQEGGVRLLKEASSVCVACCTFRKRITHPILLQLTQISDMTWSP